LITKIQYIHNGKPFDLYNTKSDDPVILPNAVTGITFFQDIDVPSVEGEIVCSDVAIYNLMPLAFGDAIRIYTFNFKYDIAKTTFQPDVETYLEFRIVSASMTSPEPGISDKDNYKQFVINIIDPNSFDSYLTARSMRVDSGVADIVADILAPTWKTGVKIEPTIASDEFAMTLPRWSPYHQLRYISKFAKFSDGTGCVFFPTIPLHFVDGRSEYEFHFTNLSALMKREESFVKEEYSLTADINRVHNIYLEKDSNSFELLINGTVIDGHKITEPMRTKLHKYLPMGDWADDDKYSQIRPTSPWAINYTDHYLTRNLVDQVLIWLTVSGDFKRKLGTAINLKFPSGFQSHNKRDYFDEERSGKYLIRSMEHVFARDADNKWIYNQKIGIVSDGYDKDEFKILKRN